MPIYRVAGLTDAQLREPWLIPRPAGVRFDRRGQRWVKVRPWLGDWGYVLERPGWGEASRMWSMLQEASGAGVAVYGILGGYGLRGRRFSREGLVPRRSFPALEDRYGGVWGWRAQLVAWYVRRRWPLLACWPRWRQATRVCERRRGERARRHRIGPCLPRRVSRMVGLVMRGEAAWTATLEREVSECLTRIRAEIGRLELEARPPKRARLVAPRMRINILPDRPR